MHIRAKQTTPQVERHRLGCEQRKVFSELTPGTPASSSGSSHAATTSTEHVTQVAETINRLEHTVTNLNLLERAAIDRAYTRHTMTMRAFIGQVLGKCFEARTFLIMNPQVAFGAPLLSSTDGQSHSSIPPFQLCWAGVYIFPYSNTTNKAEWLPDDNHEQGESQASTAATRMADLQARRSISWKRPCDVYVQIGPCDLEIWGMTLKNIRKPLLCLYKLCIAICFHI